MVCLREECEYVKENRYASDYESSLEYEEFVPRLRFLSEKLLNIPSLFKFEDEKPQKQDFSQDIEQEHILCVLVHGFNGNEYDMNRIKSYLATFYSPHFLVLRNITTKNHDTLEDLGASAA